MEPTTLGIELIKQLAAQGLGWLLFALSLIICYILYLRQQSALQDCASQTKEAAMLRDQLQEKRLEEARGYIKVFHEGTAAHEKLSAAIAVRTETLQAVSAVSLESAKKLEQLVTLVSALKSEEDTREAAWAVRVSGLTADLKRIEESSRGR